MQRPPTTRIHSRRTTRTSNRNRNTITTMVCTINNDNTFHTLRLGWILTTKIEITAEFRTVS